MVGDMNDSQVLFTRDVGWKKIVRTDNIFQRPAHDDE
jgi:hypothetical protein